MNPSLHISVLDHMSLHLFFYKTDITYITEMHGKQYDSTITESIVLCSEIENTFSWLNIHEIIMKNGKDPGASGAKRKLVEYS